MRERFAMAKQPGAPKPILWDIYCTTSINRLVGSVEAADESKAIEKGAEQFEQPAAKLLAVPRR
jgi:hypothetical protein